MKHLILSLLVVGACSLQGQETFSLQDALDYATEHNLDLKAAKTNVETAQQDIRNILSTALPQVTAGVDYQYYFNVPAQPVADFITPSVYGVLFQEGVLEPRDLGDPAINTISFFQPHNLTGKVDASMLVYDGSYRYGVKGAKLYKKLTQKEINATAYQVKSNVTKAYLNCLITEENIDIIDNNLKTITKSLNDMKVMYNEGFVESLDVDRLQLTYDNLTTAKMNLEQAVQLSKNLLKFQMGYPLNEEITLTDELDAMMDEIAADALMDLEIRYADRPEYEVIEMGEQLNELDQKRWKAAYLPSVRAFASAQASLQRANLFDNNEADWIPTTVGGLSINIPIYDGGMKRTQIEKTKINANKIAYQKEAFEQAVNLQVQNAKISITNAIASLNNAERAVKLNQDIYDRVNIKFVEGIGSSVEVSQAEASLYDAQATYINALYDLISAKTDLDIALGRI